MLKDGLWDVYSDTGMGVCTEWRTDNHVISREEQDAYAIKSFERSVVAQDGGAFAWETVPVEVFGGKGNTHVGSILYRTLFIHNFTSKAEDLILEDENMGLDTPLEHSHEPSTYSELIRHLKDMIQFYGGPISETEYMEVVLTNPKVGFY